EQGIVVESNFKVYAYTSSPLHALLLGYFCRIALQLPNLTVGHLAADSALKAMKRGIRAENIVRYLEGAAHPRALRRLEQQGGSVVPGNVRGQLEVWESSRSRTASRRAVLFEWEPGESDAAFELTRQRAEDDGSFLWSRGGNDGALGLPPALAVRAEGADRIRAFLAQQPGPHGDPKDAPSSAASARSAGGEATMQETTEPVHRALGSAERGLSFGSLSLTRDLLDSSPQGFWRRVAPWLSVGADRPRPSQGGPVPARVNGQRVLGQLRARGFAKVRGLLPPVPGSCALCPELLAAGIAALRRHGAHPDIGDRDFYSLDPYI
ncbi:unnamed protein product, partial [Polarella glacialis]